MRNILSVLCIALLLNSCKKGSDDETAPAPDDTQVSSVPTSFSQKVALEIFTGAGQAQSTDGFVKEKDIITAYPSQSIPVRIHYSDAMEIPYYATMETTFNNGTPPTFPSAMINRIPSLGYTILNRTQWMSNFLAAKAKTPYCGLAIKTSVSGTTATIEVHAGFKSGQTGAHNLTVMLTEDDVKGSGAMYDQRNSYNTNAGHLYYNAGDPIVNFSHSSTLRKMLSVNLGDAISEAVYVQGGEYVKIYTVNISAYKAADLSVVAFINKTGTTASAHEIMNAQKVKLGSNQDWD